MHMGVGPPVILSGLVNLQQYGGKTAVWTQPMKRQQNLTGKCALSSNGGLPYLGC